MLKSDSVLGIVTMLQASGPDSDPRESQLPGLQSHGLR